VTGILQILGEKWEYNETVHQLFVDFKRVYDSVRREILSYIHTEFAVPMKLITPIKMCLNETQSEVRVGKHCLKKRESLSPLLLNIECARKTR
jgi:hypothetical protein